MTLLDPEEVVRVEGDQVTVVDRDAERNIRFKGEDAAAGQVLVGKHDFSSFRAAACQADSPLRTLDALTVTEVMEATGREIHIHVRARSFLHSQVRIIAGTLRNVGDGKWGVADVAAALAARDRAAAGPTAPPDGLYLVGVGY